MKLTEAAVHEAVADVMVPLTTGKRRRKSAAAGAAARGQTGLKGAELEAAVDGLARAYPGQVATLPGGVLS